MHIAIEGMDGVGKTTAARLLAARIGFRIVEKPLRLLLDLPGESANYLRCRDYINLQTDNDPLRAWFYGLGNLILRHRFPNEDVITDRHLASNYFWCGSSGTEALFECLVTLAGKPDHTFLLYASHDVGERRLRSRAINDSDLHKTKLYEASRKKMENFLVRYAMPYTAIDTTHLDRDGVVAAMLAALPESVRKHARIL